MNLRRLLCMPAFLLSLGLSPLALADDGPQHNQTLPTGKIHKSHAGHLLTAEQRGEVDKMIETMHQQLNPLIKERQALRLQLMGKLATAGMQWDELSPLVTKINANNSQITELLAKTQLQIFQKFGVLLPPRPRAVMFHHHHRAFI
ncbi:hypothetical protein [Legionella jordanis]|uniref:Zinc resistance-associated protein n=1 Tax=Legionella jordanis TaxID=456 RepID=A0A0W0VC89_9GAMM|nr:hypothetical protein [Legionella jordanis]KTD17748.1 hypothetical protein Ljor_2054 [Legionella jordanis]RMX01611.1 hypothetical protein EAW55_11010 [Legionella jordanis]RMX21607.1 hypothetical protein EAS68_02290 [Legionella jordanis]VEH11317.1 Uncharacterised protein [Legionella jordanis]